MQKELDNKIWEEKDIRMARQSGWKNASELVAAFVNAGFYKDKAEAMEDAYGIKNMIFDDIYKNMNASGTPETPHQATNSKEMGTATDKQRKATWAIIHGKDGRPELESELPDTIDNLSFEEASDFIEKYGRKK